MRFGVAFFRNMAQFYFVLGECLAEDFIDYVNRIAADHPHKERH